MGRHRLMLEALQLLNETSTTTTLDRGTDGVSESERGGSRGQNGGTAFVVYMALTFFHSPVSLIYHRLDDVQVASVFFLSLETTESHTVVFIWCDLSWCAVLMHASGFGAWD